MPEVTDGIAKAFADCFEAYVGALAAEGRHEAVVEWLSAIFEPLVVELEPFVRNRLGERKGKQEETRAALRETALAGKWARGKVREGESRTDGIETAG